MSEPRTNWTVVLLCALVMVCEGFDLVVYGSAIPLIIEDAAIGMSAGNAGSIGSLVFLGMFLGGLSVGKISQRFTSRTIILSGTAIFSTTVLATGLVSETLSIALLRFATGVGLGIVLPTSLSLARSSSRQRQAPLVVSVTMAGIPVGGMLASVAVLLMGGVAGWRGAFIVAGAIGLVVMLVALRGLRRDDVLERGVPGGNLKSWTSVLKGSRRWLLVFFALATFADLFSYYGVTTWLTQLMREFDLPMGSSLHLAAALNLGAIGGSLVTSLVAVRVGTRAIALSCGFLAACCLLGISLHPGSPFVLGTLVVMTGAFSISAQNLLNTLVSNSFPGDMRSSALGFTLGFGRMGAVLAPTVGGYILESGLGPETVLSCFAVASLIGCGALFGALIKYENSPASTDEKCVLRTMAEEAADNDLMEMYGGNSLDSQKR